MTKPKILFDTTSADGARKMSVQPCGLVCTQRIDIAVIGDKILQVFFCGGCSGNTQGIASLVAGMNVRDAIDRLEGIDCGGKGTSCPDQLAQALRFFLPE